MNTENTVIDLDTEFFTNAHCLIYQKEEISQFNDLHVNDKEWIYAIGIKFGKLCQSENLNNTGLIIESMLELVCISKILFYKFEKWSQSVLSKSTGGKFEDLVIDKKCMFDSPAINNNYIGKLGEQFGLICLSKTNSNIEGCFSLGLIPSIIQFSAICLHWYRDIETSKINIKNQAKSQRSEI